MLVVPDLEEYNLSVLQYKLGEWAKVTFPHSSPDSVLAHFKDEVEEFLEDPCSEEAADCLILLCQYANKMGFDLMGAAQAKFKKNLLRKWGEPDDRGVVKHTVEADNY
jgi:hypothetical protein